MSSTQKLPSGKWRTRLFLGRDQDGKEYTKSFTADTKRESEFLAHEYEVNHKIDNTALALNVSVYELVQIYIEQKQQQLSPSTVRGYLTGLRNQIVLLKNCKAANFNTQRHQKWINDLSKNLSPKTVKNVNGLVVTAFKHFNLALNPVTLPKKEYKPIRIPTTEEIREIVQYFTKKGNIEMVKAIYLSSIGTLRRGEICGLMGEDVDRENNTIFVHRALVIDKDGNKILKDPKTYSSNRTVEMPKFVIDMLPDSGRVVKTSLNRITKSFRQALIDLDLPHYPFHSLRHYSASIMHAQNIPTQYIMERGGWKSEATLTRIYRNLLDDWSKKYNSKNNEFFEKNFC